VSNTTAMPSLRRDLDLVEFIVDEEAWILTSPANRVLSETSFVSTTNLNPILLLEFPNGSREWWSRMRSGSFRNFRAATHCSTESDLQ
jgi:hypothetical protein